MFFGILKVKVFGTNLLLYLGCVCQINRMFHSRNESLNRPIDWKIITSLLWPSKSTLSSFLKWGFWFLCASIKSMCTADIYRSDSDAVHKLCWSFLWPPLNTGKLSNTADPNMIWILFNTKENIIDHSYLIITRQLSPVL